MTRDEALKLARTALGVQLDALLGKAGHLRNDDRRRYAENGIKAIDEALAQPEQEPVAWLHPDWPNYTDRQSPVTTYMVNGWTPLYTTPPQRTWVGLTPQERDEINEQAYGAVPHHVVFHAAIEAKLKEKNT